MARNLGTPYMRGNSDVITNHRLAGNPLASGIVAGLDTNGNLVQASASITAKGITGLNELGYQSIVETGKSVYCKTADTTNPTIGAQVYFDATTGFITATTSAQALNAVFVSGLEDVIDGSKCVAIDFVGGL